MFIKILSSQNLFFDDQICIYYSINIFLRLNFLFSFPFLFFSLTLCFLYKFELFFHVIEFVSLQFPFVFLVLFLPQLPTLSLRHRVLTGACDPLRRPPRRRLPYWPHPHYPFPLLLPVSAYLSPFLLRRCVSSLTHSHFAPAVFPSSFMLFKLLFFSYRDMRFADGVRRVKLDIVRAFVSISIYGVVFCVIKVKDRQHRFSLAVFFFFWKKKIDSLFYPISILLILSKVTSASDAVLNMLMSPCILSFSGRWSTAIA